MTQSKIISQPLNKISSDSLRFYHIIGAIFVGIVGTLAHFAYKFSGNNIFVGFLTPINESIWEHTKLLFFPMLFYGLYMVKKLKVEYPCILSGWLCGMIVGVFFIPAAYYTYSGILGYHLAVIDILIFFLSVLLAFYLPYRLTLSCNLKDYATILCVLTGVLILCYIVFTLSPPELNVFQDPSLSEM